MAWIICPLLRKRIICNTLWIIMWYYAKLKTKNQSLQFIFSHKWLVLHDYILCVWQSVTKICCRKKLYFRQETFWLYSADWIKLFFWPISQMKNMFCIKSRKTNELFRTIYWKPYKILILNKMFQFYKKYFLVHRYL